MKPGTVGLGLLGLISAAVLVGCLGTDDPCNVDGVITLTYPPSQFTPEELPVFALVEAAWNSFLGRRVLTITPQEESSCCDIRISDPGSGHLGETNKAGGYIRIKRPYECNMPGLHGAVCFQAILMHEIGHMLGMHHVDDPNAVMYSKTATVTPNESDREQAKRVGLI